MQNFARLNQKRPILRKFFRKFWDFLIKICMENWHFSQIFTEFLKLFLPLLRKYYLWKMPPDFYNNYFGLGGRSPCSPSLRHCYQKGPTSKTLWRCVPDWEIVNSKHQLRIYIFEKIFEFSHTKISIENRFFTHF